VRSQRVVLVEPGVDHDLRFEEAVDSSPFQELVAHGAVEALHERVVLRAALLDERRLDARSASQSRRLAAMNSPVVGPQQSWPPVLGEEPLELRTTSLAPIERSTRQPKATRVYSSTTFRIRREAPSRVRPLMKSYDHTWLGAAAGRFQAAPSAVPCASCQRLGCVWVARGGPPVATAARSACGSPASPQP
jgi:hypothetical protein